MKGEIGNFVKVWLSVVASLCYSHMIGKSIKQGATRLLAILPVIVLFLALPLNLTSIFLGGPTAFFVAWLATFKLLLFAYGKGPLSSYPPLPLPHFISLACFPIKIQNDPTQNCSKSPLNYAVKLLIYSTNLLVYQNRHSLHPKVFMFLFSVYTYIIFELILALVAALVRVSLGVELEPQFNEPYLSTSLQDFWGRRWNLMASNILRPTVYDPVRAVSSRWIGTKWVALPAVITAFFVSGMMHELIFYYLGRKRPTWDLTCFFLLHGVCVSVEIAVKKAVRRKWRLPALVSGILAMGFVMVTGMWLFLPALMRFDADVRGNRELVSLIEFVKNIGTTFGSGIGKVIEFLSLSLRLLQSTLGALGMS
ncbi:probable long-chain-alcohol O-fatty-acyltransferase 5 [Humulus lupulus]|uniref:probable long-chain-alcohol O-fatty-acyltransferase 5 n=1 Tax=Humulus lupulus TaxID=3486 RepID=UPI002B408947|nr:probable long-chain-alcohol O-fatty-acyltransferase 5 [Humulus lupulus]